MKGQHFLLKLRSFVVSTEKMIELTTRLAETYGSPLVDPQALRPMQKNGIYTTIDEAGDEIAITIWYDPSVYYTRDWDNNTLRKFYQNCAGMSITPLAKEIESTGEVYYLQDLTEYIDFQMCQWTNGAPSILMEDFPQYLVYTRAQEENVATTFKPI